MVYLPAHFAETRREELFALIHDHPLGTVVQWTGDELIANHIPFLLDERAGEFGTLIGHVARGSELWPQAQSGREALIVFQNGEGYISPSWYPTKQETHQVVPTYNYSVVHAYGPIVVHDDEKWLRGVVGRLTKKMEANLPTPWKMADAPQEYLATMLAGIVGIEIPIARLIGKFKLGQNRTLADREGAVAGLRNTGSPADAHLAALMQSAIDGD